MRELRVLDGKSRNDSLVLSESLILVRRHNRPYIVVLFCVVLIADLLPLRLRNLLKRVKNLILKLQFGLLK